MFLKTKERKRKGGVREREQERGRTGGEKRLLCFLLRGKDCLFSVSLVSKRGHQTREETRIIKVKVA